MQDEISNTMQLTKTQIIEELLKAAKGSGVFEVKGHLDRLGRVRDYVLRPRSVIPFYSDCLFGSLKGLDSTWNPGDYDDDVWEEAKKQLRRNWMSGHIMSEAQIEAAQGETGRINFSTGIISRSWNSRSMFDCQYELNIESHDVGQDGLPPYLIGTTPVCHLEILHVYEHSAPKVFEEGSIQAAARDITLQLPLGKYLGILVLTPENTKSIRALAEDESREFIEGTEPGKDAEILSSDAGQTDNRVVAEAVRSF